MTRNRNAPHRVTPRFADCAGLRGVNYYPFPTDEARLRRELSWYTVPYRAVTTALGAAFQAWYSSRLMRVMAA